MGNFGKKTIALIIAIIMSVFFVGCAKGGQNFAKTPEEEYDRICSIDGDGIIFDFSSLSKLQIEQTVALDSTLLRENNGKEAVTETSLFQLDCSKKDSPASYGTSKYVERIYIPDLTEQISYNQGRTYGYGNLRDIDGRQYSDYDDYRSYLPGSPDAIYRNSIKLLPREKFESMSGSKSGSVYTIEADVKESEFAAFYEWFESFYPYVNHTDDAGNGKFYNKDDIRSVKFLIKSTRTQLSEVWFSAVIPANPDAFGADALDDNYEVKELVTVNARTVFSRSGFEIEWIK